MFLHIHYIKTTASKVSSVTQKEVQRTKGSNGNVTLNNWLLEKTNIIFFLHENCSSLPIYSLYSTCRVLTAMWF